METKDFLKFRIDEQLNKIKGRIIYSAVLILIPLLLLIVNILSLTNNILPNPRSLINLLFFVLSGLLWYAVQTLIKNIIGFIVLKNTKQRIVANDFNALNRTKSYLFVFNEYYRQINLKLGEFMQNDVFHKIKNKETLKFLNIKYFVFDVILCGLIFGCFMSEWALKTDHFHWELILSIVVLAIFLTVGLSFLILRQIILNLQIKKYNHHQIEEYEYSFKYNFLLISHIKEKLENANQLL
ncbi:hypothetical protein ELUMI_v1c07650 [Williamsoniiplasma luminosum]|uniref:Uncharacterized protein n=1 Tax=Williamsoniiplasma luminosum TaxID=214888 RepID=A0A2K8NUP6_9MOLU|nr:hypothetical protein [Williamsoniiplasma luminosum]ATZ17487.1 hypothetical protein ELUMI_v1c07650 [Williamsoniiplasma luminosum]